MKPKKRYWHNAAYKYPKFVHKFPHEKETDVVDVLLADGTQNVAWYNTKSGWENMETEFTNVTHWRYQNNQP